jgi:hypothetical protein
VSVYAPTVRTLIARLVLLAAMLLMPFGMAVAPAGTPHHSMMAGMPTGHCSDQAPSHDRKGAIAECTMACAASLPAAATSARDPLLIVCEPAFPSESQILRGLHPETATPPPKRS